MKQLKVSEIGKFIDATPTEMAVMFIGDTGIGKTQCIKKYAEENNIFLKTLILSQVEASECLGIPVQTQRMYKGKVYQTLETAIPNWVFDLAEHENAILYLDEFFCAEPQVMNSFLNFITEKSVNGIDLSHVKIVASTNIGSYTFEPDTNMLSRFCMFYVKNNEYNSYLKRKYKSLLFDNNYVDEEVHESCVFGIRSLKPRCQELLCLIKDKKLVEYFYEGYTNVQLIPKIHSNKNINDIYKSYISKDENGDYIIKKEDIPSLAGLLYNRIISRSRRANIVEVCLNTLNDLKYDKSRLREEIYKILAEA